MFHPTDNTIKADLIIEINAPELTGAIPCHKQFMIDHVPLIEVKFREDSNLIKQESGEVSVFTLGGCLFDPQLVCDFFACFYEGRVDFTKKNAAAFYWIARYLLCEEIRVKCEDFMKDNMCAEFLVDAWILDVNFREPCMDFIKKINGEFRLIELKHIENMDLSVFLDFIEQLQVPVKLDVYEEIQHHCDEMCQPTAQGCFANTIEYTEIERQLFDANQFIKLKLKWLNQNSSTENYEQLIYETDFDELSDQEKFDFYRDIILEEIVDVKMIKKITEHIFKRKRVNLKANVIAT